MWSAGDVPPNPVRGSRAEVHVIGDASVPGRLRTAVLDGGATVGRSV